MLNDATGFSHVYFACGYTDLRRGIDGLVSLVKYSFRLDPCEMNRSLSSRQMKKQNVFSRISKIRSWFSFMQLPASCGNPLVQGSLTDADAAGSCSNG